MRSLTLHQRAELFNQAFPHLLPLTVGKQAGQPFMYSFWFVGGGNISDFYGSYQVEYLRRMDAIFPDCKGKREFVHLFAGSIPPSADYTVVGLPDGGYTPEFACDAHELSSRLPFNPSLIMADPPYSEAANGEYAICDINRQQVVAECGRVLRPGGFLVWQDQNLPVFSNNALRFVGLISYVRSTGNRFRGVSIFQKPANAK